MSHSNIRASTSNEPSSHTPTQRLLTSLRSPIASLEELEDIFLLALTALDSVPLAFKATSGLKVKTDLRGDDILHVIPTVQHLILSLILPTWLMPLREAGHEQLASAFFCPSWANAHDTAHRKASGMETRCTIATSGLSTLLSHLRTLSPRDPGPAAILAFAVATLEDIVVLYPPDVVHDAMFSSGVGAQPSMDDRRSRDWEDYIRSACSVPGRIANALQGQRDVLSGEQVDHGPYFSNFCVSAEKIIFRISQRPSSESLIQSHSQLLLKLLHLGLFPPSPPTLPTQPSFFSSTLPTIRRRLHLASAAITSSTTAVSQYSATWAAVVRSLPATAQQMFLASLLGALECQVGGQTTAVARRKVGDGASVLHGLMGKLGGNTAGVGGDDDDVDDEEMWGTVSAVVCGAGQTWDFGLVRVVVCWIADPHDSRVDESALERLLNSIVALWTNPEHIRHSLLSQHRYTTSLLLLAFAGLPAPAPVHQQLAFSPPFIAAISTYLGHLDLAVRRCGMLTAEVVAARCGQALAFGGWEGPGEGLDWARALREWQSDWTADGFYATADDEGEEEEKMNDTPEIHDAHTPPPDLPASPPDSDDDSLAGYDSPASSRSPSPTPSELAEIEKDPTLRVGRPPPVARPVYLAQLAALLRTDKNNDANEAERVDVALACAEALVRRKKGFGTELEENAVELAIALALLQDNYELAEFEEKRQGALTALVECCPRKAALTLVEQFFTNQYSVTQRCTMLTALALGARTLAGLPVPPTRIAQTSVAFPSKMLPPALHRRYATPEEARSGDGQVQRLVQGITGTALERSREEVGDAIPEVVRERQLRVGQLGSGRISEVGASSRSRTGGRDMIRDQKRDMTFADVAAEHFIMPLVNHMWQHLRDIAMRVPGRRGLGTGIILGAVVLAQFLGTLAVLAHAARHSPAFLRVVAPGALELALALGTRRAEDTADSGRRKPGEEHAEEAEAEAAVLTAALEVALVVLDACVDLDGGRVLGLDHTALLLAVREWAGGVLSVLEGGRRARGQGGTVEGRVGGAAAGVVLGAEKVVERWGRSMVGL